MSIEAQRKLGGGREMHIVAFFGSSILESCLELVCRKWTGFICTQKPNSVHIIRQMVTRGGEGCMLQKAVHEDKRSLVKIINVKNAEKNGRMYKSTLKV